MHVYDRGYNNRLCQNFYLWLLLSQIQMQTCPQNQVPRVRSHCSVILGLKLFQGEKMLVSRLLKGLKLVVSIC